MELHEIIKSILTKHGRDLLCKDVFINYLADYQAFDDRATRRVMQTILQMGYGRKMYIMDQAKSSLNLIRVKSFIKECVDEGFQEDIVTRVFESLEIGLGWIHNNSPADNELNRQSQEKKRSRVISIRLSHLGRSIQATYDLLQNNNVPLSEIANLRGLATSTIYDHVSKLIKFGLIDVHKYVNSSDYDEIRKAYESFTNPFLRDIYESLSGKYTYDVIRLVVADIQSPYIQKPTIMKDMRTSAHISCDMYKEYGSVRRVAKERSLTERTIYRHLFTTKTLNPDDCISANDFQKAKIIYESQPGDCSHLLDKFLDADGKYAFYFKYLGHI